MEKLLARQNNISISVVEIVDDPSAFFVLRVQDQTLRRDINELFLLQKVVNKAVNELLRSK